MPPITLDDLARALRAVPTTPPALSAGQQRVRSSLRGMHTTYAAYGNAQTQRMALDVMPASLAARARARDTPRDDALLRDILHWFKTEFFTFVRTLPCAMCNSTDTHARGAYMQGDHRVEQHVCASCGHTTLFHRYNDVRKLLGTARGRCGEAANMFALMCIAAGYDTRYILDLTDHVWVEAWSNDQGRWVHMDPCEDAFDTPLMYEEGWGKNLNHVFARSQYEVYDVTRRYTRKMDSLSRMCAPAWLSAELCLANARMQALLPPETRAALQARRVQEVRDMRASRSTVKRDEMHPRRSGHE